MADLMKMLIINTKDGWKSLRAANNLKYRIIGKLETNSPLTRRERKSLIGWLRRGVIPTFSRKRKFDCNHNLASQTIPEFESPFSSNFSKKRKLNEDNCSCQKHEKQNKIVQTDSSTESISKVQDGLPQTDLLDHALKVEASANDRIDEMKRLAACETLDNGHATNLMNDTFDDRRNFILLKEPPVTLIKDKYPLLFAAKDEVKNELDRIFYVGKCEEFMNKMKDYSKFILKHCNENDEICVLTEKKIKNARTPLQKVYAQVVGSVFALSRLLDEEFRYIHLKDYPHGSKDIYPHIDASGHSLKDLFSEDISYYIVVEGMQVCRACNFLEAILCLVSSFFIFNIDYPESCKRTFTCFEKLYLCGNDTFDVDEKTSQIIKLFSLLVKDSKKHDIRQ